MAMDTLHDLYVDELKDLYSAENQIIKALPSMVKAADSDDLKRALQAHLNVTKGHVDRLSQILSNLGESGKGKKCVGIEGVLAEGKEILKEKGEPDVVDAGIIGAAQKVEHYEIASYGTARTHAETLGHSQAANLLQQTLEEEKEADQSLTQLAESSVNPMAANEDQQENQPVKTTAW